MGKIKKYIFYILYAISFLGALIIGLLGSSFFAYDKFNSLWANILYILFLALLFITAFVQEIISSRAVADIIVNSAVFIGGLLFLLLFYFLGGVFILLSLIYSGVLLAVIGIRFTFKLRVNCEAKPDLKRILAAGSLLIFSMYALMIIKFVSEIYWAWALIPATIIFAVTIAVTYFLLKNVWGRIYTTEARSIGNAIGIGLIIFILSFAYSASAIGISNCIFDGDPVQTEYTVIDKNITSGSRTATTHKVKVIIDGKERWIPVPTTEYFELEEGDIILIDYYSGAFGFAYYAYHGKT